MNSRCCLLMLLAGIMLAGCSHEQKNTVSAPLLPAKPVIMQPFRFHKMIEVSPGQDFDILSWGRGSSEIGAFLILHSDSDNMKYTTTTGDLDGDIVDVYNSDMDMDGNPEILIQAKAKDTTNYAIIYAFEFNNNKAQKLDFPKLTHSQSSGYRGGDNFYIQDGKFMREFPIYNGSGKNAKPTGQKRVLQYGLSDNQFTVQQLSKDSVKINNNPAVAETPVAAKKTNTISKKTTTASKKKKHKTEAAPAHHKKKKRRRHSQD